MNKFSLILSVAVLVLWPSLRMDSSRSSTTVLASGGLNGITVIDDSSAGSAVSVGLDTSPIVSTCRPTSLVLRERSGIGIHKPLLYYFIRDYPYQDPLEGNFIKPWNLVVTNRDVESKLLRVDVNNPDNKRNIVKKKNILYLTRFAMNTAATNP